MMAATRSQSHQSIRVRARMCEVGANHEAVRGAHARGLPGSRAQDAFDTVFETTVPYLAEDVWTLACDSMMLIKRVGNTLISSKRMWPFACIYTTQRITDNPICLTM